MFKEEYTGPMPEVNDSEADKFDQMLADKRREDYALISEGLPRTDEEKLRLIGSATAAIMNLRGPELPQENFLNSEAA